MAQAVGLLDQDQFSCSICLDLLKDPWLFPVDTVTVWAVLRAAGIRMIILVSTAVPSADRPSLQGLSWAETPCWLKWWRN
uniref:Uncharacterized protein n=1 Tax=Anguilla anguilla TaxID=7936 RepID=A0A0E9Y1N3_ANGAN